MIRKRSFIKLPVLAALLAAMCLFAGCGSSNSESATEPQITTTVPEEPTSVGAMGHVICANGDTYYWKYSAASFDATGIGGFTSKDAENQMILRGEDGTENVLFEANGRGAFVLAGDMIFYGSHDWQVFSVSMEDQSVKSWGSGRLMGVTEDGSVVFWQTYTDNGNAINAISAGELTSKVLVENAVYITCHDGVVYYSPNCEDMEKAQAGQVTLSRILPDGTGQADLYTTAPDMYDDLGYSAASVSQIRFSEDHIYFSYGSIAGTGLFFQGGKVVRLGYDGSDAQILAGTEELVDAQFIVNADGSVTAFPLQYVSMFKDLEELSYSKGIVYRYDPVTGEPKELLQPQDYSAVGPGLAQVTDESGMVIAEFVEVTDGKAYYLMHHGAEDPENSIGWRVAYKRTNSAFMVKDMQTGQVSVIYQF